MRALKFITGHVTYNPAYTYKFQLNTTHVEINLKPQFLIKSVYYIVASPSTTLLPSIEKLEIPHI